MLFGTRGSWFCCKWQKFAFHKNEFLPAEELEEVTVVGASMELKLGSTIARGNISDDTIYNGNIEFLDISGKKVEEQFYSNNIPNGARKKYDANGSLIYNCNYVNGLINGYAYEYGDSGLLSDLNYFYYGIPMGPVIHYNKNHIQEYAFFSFDGKLLFDINYDSIGQRKITDFQREYFYL